MTKEYILFLRRMLLDVNFRHRHLELRRLTRMPRYSPATTDILGKPLEIVDNTSFFAMYDEIFENKIYRFAAKSDSPRIIDGGANIGMSAIFFKTLYPKAKVIAFEPDNGVHQVLKKNLASFGFEDIEVHEAALWSENTELSFLSEGADSGRVADTTDLQEVSVKAVRGKDFLLEHVDFLKLDIEGAELEVLEDCFDVLQNVDNLFVEYHSFAGKPQTVGRLFEILIDAGFRIKGSVPNMPKSPFCDRGQYLGMDFLMNVFAYREA